MIEEQHNKFRHYTVEERALDMDRVREDAYRYQATVDRTVGSNSLSLLTRLVDGLRRLPGCEIRLVKDLFEPLADDQFVVAIRHDMDDEPFSSLAVGASVHAAGARSSFYVLHTAPYYGGVEEGVFLRNTRIGELLRTLQDGYQCEVGLHADGLWVYQQWGMDGAASLRAEIQWLRSTGLQIVGTAAHNSAPSYGAENFELFKGRAVFGRNWLYRNEQVIPLQTLDEGDLGLSYEANFPQVNATCYTPALSAYLSFAPAGGIRNSEWMKRYLVANPYCRWGADYNIWLLGPDKWAIGGHQDRDPAFLWDATLEDVLEFLRRMPKGMRVVLHIHPVYFSTNPNRRLVSESNAQILSPLTAISGQLGDLSERLHTVQAATLAAKEESNAQLITISGQLGDLSERLHALEAATSAQLGDLNGRLHALQATTLAAKLQATTLAAKLRRIKARVTRAVLYASYAWKAFFLVGPCVWALFPRGRKQSAERNRILMLTVSQIDADPRINKVARAMVGAGYQVDILCLKQEVVKDGTALLASVVRELVAPGVTYVRIALLAGWQHAILFHQENFRRAARSWKYDVVHANDLTTLLTGWLLARDRGVPLVYDAHEMWSENVRWNGREWIPMGQKARFAARLWEGFLLHYVDIIVSVSQSICEEFSRRYRLSAAPLLLPNFPELRLLDQLPNSAIPSIRTLCGLSDTHFVTLYLGGVNSLRNIENVIRAHAYLPDRYVFVIRGPGVDTFEAAYRALADECGVASRVFFLPPVAIDEVVLACQGADCGIVMLRNICLNFYWFYPNKFFEYMLAGLPVAVSNFPVVTAHVQREQCGVTFDPDDPKNIADALLKLGADPERAREMGRRGKEGILQRYNWNATIAGLVSAYKRLQEA